MQVDLAALGLTPERLEQCIVDEAVDRVVSGSEEWAGLESLTRQAKALVSEQFRQRFDAFAAEHVAPRIDAMIDAMEFRTTNGYGEQKAPPMTVREYIDFRVSNYLTEDVDSNGKTKAQGGYGWNKSGTRLAVAIDRHIQHHLDQKIKEAFADINKAAAQAIQKAVQDTISRVRIAADVNVK